MLIPRKKNNLQQTANRGKHTKLNKRHLKYFMINKILNIDS